MSTFKLFVCWIILLIMPSFLLYPQDNFKQAGYDVQLVRSGLPKNLRKTRRYPLVTYNQILKLLADIESGKEYKDKDIRRINRFLAYLAEQGSQPNSLALREDITDLLGNDIGFAYADDEWGLVAEALVPEIRQLVTEWETIPSEKRGELAGYALGKYGADILIPGIDKAVRKCCNKLKATSRKISLRV